MLMVWYNHTVAETMFNVLHGIVRWCKDSKMPVSKTLFWPIQDVHTGNIFETVECANATKQFTFRRKLDKQRLCCNLLYIITSSTVRLLAFDRQALASKVRLMIVYQLEDFGIFLIYIVCVCVCAHLGVT